MEDIKDVYAIVSSIENLTGLGVCLYDLNHFLAYNYGDLEKNITGHYCEFCKAVRSLPGGREACIKNDVEIVRELAQSYKKPFFNVCHIGICELIVPIMKADSLIGVLFIGQCCIGQESNFDRIYENIKQFQGEHKYFKSLFESLPTASRQQLTSAGRLAQLSFEALVNQKDFNIFEQKSDVVTLAKGYIASNYMNDISLGEISSQIHVNPSYLSRKFKEVTGDNISEYITKIRIEQAKKLLAYTKIPIIHISYNTGFANQNYFARVFKQYVNQTPREYRKNVKFS